MAFSASLEMTDKGIAKIDQEPSPGLRQVIPTGLEDQLPRNPDALMEVVLADHLHFHAIVPSRCHCNPLSGFVLSAPDLLEHEDTLVLQKLSEDEENEDKEHRQRDIAKRGPMLGLITLVSLGIQGEPSRHA